VPRLAPFALALAASLPPAIGTLLALRVASVDLFDFWQSPPPEPRAGVRLAVSALTRDLCLDGFASDETEIREDGATRVGLLGWGLRLASVPPASASRGSRP